MRSELHRFMCQAQRLPFRIHGIFGRAAFPKHPTQVDQVGVGLAAEEVDVVQDLEPRRKSPPPLFEPWRRLVPQSRVELETFGLRTQTVPDWGLLVSNWFCL